MQNVKLALAGFGNVGKAFVRLVDEKRDLCRDRYGLDLQLHAVLKSNGGFFSERPSGLSGLKEIAELHASEAEGHPAWKSGLRVADTLSLVESGVLVECTPTNLKTGEPGLDHITRALEKKWHVAAASKGALVLNFKKLMTLAGESGVRLKYSGATAAALPTLDVALLSLAGTEILRIEGILTGVTNYILSRMGEGSTFQEAVGETQAKGIAESDPSLDIDGWDTACKILLLSNSAAGTNFQLSDIRRESIRNVTLKDIKDAEEEGKTLKLLGKLVKEGGEARAEVRLFALEKSHPLYNVSGTNKGVTFFTDTMGSVTVTGGRSDPKGTAAALLKDILNIYRSMS